MLDKIIHLRKISHTACFNSEDCPHCIAKKSLDESWNLIEMAGKGKHCMFLPAMADEAHAIIDKAYEKIIRGGDNEK